MEIIKLIDLLDKKENIYTYNGAISQDMLVDACETLEKSLQNIKVNTNVLNKVLSILTEQLHNIMSYSKENISKEDNKYKSKGLCILGYDKKEHLYYIGSANLISFNDISSIIDKLEFIKKLNPLEIKEQYKKERRTHRNKHSRGGGLGFLEMARRSDLKLSYKITQIDKQTSFFEIIAYVKGY